MKTLYSSFIILIATLTVYCGPSTGGDDGLAILAALDEGGGGCIKAPGETTTTGSGTFTTQVNATASGCWAYINLKAGGVETTKSGNWDLRFKRFIIGTNSGSSGSGNGGSCGFGDGDPATDINDVTVGGCTIAVDSVLSQTGGGGFGTATESASPSLWTWYNYNGTTHVLTAYSIGYLIQGSDGVSNFAIEVTDYYDNANTSGFPTIKWKEL
ncbi:heme-binding protein HmuY [Leptospira koniambonensis]|uniref:Heme-binding protein HmuY n=1 Tax=Leptospira koniambonensis TaxID=2484950 RepID=A0A4V3JNI7_9LEPT|nr:HmuY family protein [Leptospira koniambonensis]TGL35129.1 heme-binding protein HmuY [Leptospira koniambonensis]